VWPDRRRGACYRGARTPAGNRRNGTRCRLCGEPLPSRPSALRYFLLPTTAVTKLYHVVEVAGGPKIVTPRRRIAKRKERCELTMDHCPFFNCQRCRAQAATCRRCHEPVPGSASSTCHLSHATQLKEYRSGSPPKRGVLRSRWGDVDKSLSQPGGGTRMIIA
jgi:hypothetical protein